MNQMSPFGSFGSLAGMQQPDMNPQAGYHIPQQPAMEHQNTWMQYPGQGIGTIFGSMYGGPIGGMAGGQAGKNIGLMFGDATGGNWNGVAQDAYQALPPELMNFAKMFGGG